MAFISHYLSTRSRQALRSLPEIVCYNKRLQYSDGEHSVKESIDKYSMLAFRVSWNQNQIH